MKTPSYKENECLQAEDSFAQMILEYAEEQFAIGTSRESIRHELMLGGFDEESVEMVTEMAETNYQVRCDRQRNEDMRQSLLFVLFGLLMLMLSPAGQWGNSSRSVGGLLICAGLLLFASRTAGQTALAPVHENTTLQ